MVWQLLLRSWIQQAASQQLHAAAQSALNEHLSRQSADAQSAETGAAPPCDVGLVFALGVELGGLEDRMQQVRKFKGDGFVVRCGRLCDRNIAVVESGPGQEAARRGAKALIAGHHPQWVVSAGFAGGLVDVLSKRRFLMAQEIASPDGRVNRVDFRVSAEALQSTPHVRVGRLLTVDQIIRTTAEKRALAEKHQADAVDMETFAVSEVCRETKTKFMALRIISDSVHDELPVEIERLFQQTTGAGRVGAALGAVMRRPGAVKDLWQLKEDAVRASDMLAVFLEGIVAQLAPASPDPSAAPKPESSA